MQCTRSKPTFDCRVLLCLNSIAFWRQHRYVACFVLVLFLFDHECVWLIWLLSHLFVWIVCRLLTLIAEQEFVDIELDIIIRFPALLNLVAVSLLWQKVTAFVLVSTVTERRREVR